MALARLLGVFMAAVTLTGVLASGWAQTSSRPATRRGSRAEGATRPVRAATQSAPTPATRASAPAVAASDPSAKAKAESAIPKPLLEAAKRSFVIVHTWYKKDTSEPESFLESNRHISEIYSEYIDQKRPAEAVGVVMDQDGRVLVCDNGIEDRFVEKIEIKDIEGNTYPAKREKLLFGTAGAVLKADAPAGKLLGLKFTPLKHDAPDCQLYQADMAKQDEQWRVQVAPLSPCVEFKSGEACNAFYGYRSGYGPGMSMGMGGYGLARETCPSIISDADGAIVGVCVESFMDLQQKECQWRGAELLAGEGLDWKALNDNQEQVRKTLTPAVYEVVVAFHQGGGGDEPSYRYGAYNRFSRYGSRSEISTAAGREITVFGVAISDTEILVPVKLDSKQAAQIDKISVKFGPLFRKQAEFVGAYKDLGACLIRLSLGKFTGRVELAGKDPERMKPFWVAKPRKRFGATYVDLTTNRLYGRQRGYAGQYHWYCGKGVDDGSILVDLEGKLAGLYVQQRLEHEEERALEQSDRYGGGEGGRVFLISELREKLAKPEGQMDPKIVVKTKTQSKRRAWFGVEFVTLDSDLAEQLKVESPTKDGQLGFLVNAVYPGSPAQKLGIEVSDILLEVRTPTLPYPIRLENRLGGREDSYSHYDVPMLSRHGGGDEDEPMGPVMPTWKSRQNGLTRALDAIGIGKEITITYFRSDGKGGGKTETVKYTIQQAPPDFDSAAKWKNRKVGLTVKDVTYEIRLALGLKDDDPGLIIANVEEGSPTDTARIYTNEIITHLDGTALKTARQMRELVASALKSGKDKVRLTVLRMGKTRFADLSIKAYNSQDDEGLEEDEPTTKPAEKQG